MPTLTHSESESSLKRRIAAICDFAGINRLALAAQKRFLPRFIRAVNYHEVRDDQVDLFEQHLKYLRANYDNIDLAALDSFFDTGNLPGARPGLIISFDDGYRSHSEIVAPILEKHGFTGWFFVAVDEMNLAAHSPDVYSNGMDEAQMTALDKRHQIGSHTQTHRRLNRDVPRAEMEAEILGSREHLGAILGREVNLFCWVGGEEESYSKEAADLIRKGYRYAFMTNSCPITSTTNPLQMQRTNIEASFPLSQVRFQLSGFMDLFYLRTRRRVNRLTA